MSNLSWNLRLAWKKRKKFFFIIFSSEDMWLRMNEWWKSERNKERMYEFTWCAIVTCERYRRKGDKNVNERSFDMNGFHWENIDRNVNRIRSDFSLKKININRIDRIETERKEIIRKIWIRSFVFLRASRNENENERTWFFVW